MRRFVPFPSSSSSSSSSASFTFQPHLEGACKLSIIIKYRGCDASLSPFLRLPDKGFGHWSPFLIHSTHNTDQWFNACWDQREIVSDSSFPPALNRLLLAARYLIKMAINFIEPSPMTGIASLRKVWKLSLVLSSLQLRRVFWSLRELYQYVVL